MEALLPRWVSARVDEAMADTPVVVIQGARQTGKSTIAEQIASEHGVQVFTMDDAGARAAAEADPEAFVATAGDELLVIDEIQRLPQLILPIKAAVDRDRRPGRFLLTGSADLMRVPGAEDSLAGRAETIHLAPLSQGELSGRRDDFVTRWLAPEDLAGWQTEWTRPRYVEAICAGGYPAAVRRNQRRRETWLLDYADRIVRRDSRDLTRADPVRLANALRLVAAAQAGEVVATRFARDLGVSEMTARADLQRLADLFLVTEVPAWSRSLTRRRTNKAKGLVVDSGLAAVLGDIGPAELNSPLGTNYLGNLLEGFVLAELLRQSSWSDTRFRVGHYRESGGIEVDGVLQLPGGRVLGIEVKASVSAREDHARNLKALRTRIGTDFAGGIVFYLGDRLWSLGDQVWAVPVAALWEL
ncbi:MAG TPA: ATP-binding protein [Arachnia sp.]|nr:ATP-binding protein [Arachnia sp.]HMR14111.1 ATP-binding protein [Arachnia sp.]